MNPKPVAPQHGITAFVFNLDTILSVGMDVVVFEGGLTFGMDEHANIIAVINPVAPQHGITSFVFNLNTSQSVGGGESET